MERQINSLILEKEETSEGTGVVRMNVTMLIPDALLFLLSALLGSYTPFAGICPFGAACVLASWYSGLNPYFPCGGAALGAFLSGNWAYGASIILLGALIWAVERKTRVKRIFRLLLGFAAEGVLNVVFALIFGKNALLCFGSATVSVFGALVISSGLQGVRSAVGGRALSDTELLTLSAVAGLLTLSMKTFSIFGQSPAVVFAAVSVLFSSYRLGMASVACAVMIAAGRILATGGDMHFIAVLATTALIASSVRSLGKWAVLLCFLGLSTLITALLGGNGVIGYVECGIACLIFAVVPQRLYMPEGLRAELKSSVRSDPKFTRLTYRMASLAEVLRELARVRGGDDGRLLRNVSDAIRGSLSQSSPAPAVFTVEHGAAQSAGGSSSGDSIRVRELDGRLLLAISDGMGSGEEAGRESRSALALLSDLLSVGFTLSSAVSSVNSLLLGRSRGDMYATLDVMLIDLSDGTALIKKHGAPESWVLRDGKAYALTSDALPVGIIDGEETDAGSLKLLDGDVIVMTSDGVSDALGNGTAGFPEIASLGMEKAAALLLDEAAARGGRDDMSVITARITRKSR